MGHHTCQGDVPLRDMRRPYFWSQPYLLGLRHSAPLPGVRRGMLRCRGPGRGGIGILTGGVKLLIGSELCEPTGAVGENAALPHPRTLHPARSMVDCCVDAGNHGFGNPLPSFTQTGWVPPLQAQMGR